MALMSSMFVTVLRPPAKVEKAGNEGDNMSGEGKEDSEL